MRVLTSSVLVMQAIVLGLAIPVVLVARELPAWVGWLLAGLAVAAMVLAAMARRPWFVPAGWALQGATSPVGFSSRCCSSSAESSPRCGGRRCGSPKATV